LYFYGGKKRGNIGEKMKTELNKEVKEKKKRKKKNY